MCVSETKEVYFDKFCPICKNAKLEENEDPCYDCLNEPVNINSHKPLYYEEK